MVGQTLLKSLTDVLNRSRPLMARLTKTLDCGFNSEVSEEVSLIDDRLVVTV